jgi:RimJ/RimL family protein N-acetyltransferase
MPDIRGRLVRLRPMQRADLAHLHRWLNDHDVMQYWDGRDHPATFDRVEARFRKSVEGTDRESERYMIESLEDERVIGMAQHGRVHPRARHAQVDLLIGDPAYRDAGFGTDAMRMMVQHLFESLRVHRVWLTLRASNVRAMRGAEKVGFTREGVLREHDMLEGQLVDVVVYGMLAREWSPEQPSEPLPSS